MCFHFRSILGRDETKEFFCILSSADIYLKRSVEFYFLQYFSQEFYLLYSVLELTGQKTFQHFSAWPNICLHLLAVQLTLNQNRWENGNEKSISLLLSRIIPHSIGYRRSKLTFFPMTIQLSQHTLH